MLWLFLIAAVVLLLVGVSSTWTLIMLGIIVGFVYAM